jgi:hypothetical protein
VIDPVVQALELLDRDPHAEEVAPELRALLGDVYESLLCTSECRDRRRLDDPHGGPPTDPDDRSHELLHHIDCGVWVLAEKVVVPLLSDRARALTVIPDSRLRAP